MRYFFGATQDGVLSRALRRRVSLFVICLVVALSSITSALSPGLVSAAPIADGKDANWLAASYWYSQAVSQCIEKIAGNRIAGSIVNLDQNSVKSGAWFNSPITGDLRQVESTGSYFARSFLGDIGDDGRQMCAANDNELLKRALAHWGVDPATAACESGLYERENKTDCAQGNGNFQLKTDTRSKKQIIDAYINNVVYGGKAPTLDGAEAYVYYRDTLLNGCAWGAQALTTRPAGANVYVVPSFKKEGDKLITTETYYIGDKSPETGRWTMTNPDADRTCAQLADLIKPGGAYANAFGALVKAGKAIDTPPQTCSDDNANSAECKEENTTSCAIPGVGWLVCQIGYAASGFIGFMYGILSYFLNVPSISTNTTSSLYKTWVVMRNIANVIFVVLFLLIIYSQIVGGGKK